MCCSQDSVCDSCPRGRPLSIPWIRFGGIAAVLWLSAAIVSVVGVNASAISHQDDGGSYGDAVAAANLILPPCAHKNGSQIGKALDSGHCCSWCPPGLGVKEVCRADTHVSSVTSLRTEQVRERDETAQTDTVTFRDTQCEACQSGATYSDAPSGHLPCRTCSRCPSKSRIRKACNTTHDTECECERDYYQESLTGTPSYNPRVNIVCKACDLCPHGWGAARPCSPMHNTVCRKCPPGSYSSLLSATLGCVLCSVCREDQVTLHECTPIQDTVCADKDMGHPSRRVITKPLESLVGQTEDYNNQGIIFVYCAILGAVVLGLLVYVVVKQWRLKQAANKLAQLNGPCGGATVPLTAGMGNQDFHINAKGSGHRYLWVDPELEVSPSGSRRLHGSDGSRGSDSAIVVPGSDGSSRDKRPITLATRLREISSAKRREIEASLYSRQDSKDWKALAKELGYTSCRVASFEQRAQEKLMNPSRVLFAEWSKREESTVQNLLEALRSIGRHDLTLSLLPAHDQSAVTLPRTRHLRPIDIV